MPPCLACWVGFLWLDRVFWLWVGSVRASLFDVSGRVFLFGSGFWAFGWVGPCLPVWCVGLGFLRLIGFFWLWVGSGRPVPPSLTCRVVFFRVGSGFWALGRVGPCFPVWRVGSGFFGIDRVF
jgi:hypothetical protein